MRVRTADAGTALVWIDSQEAIIVHWTDRALVERIDAGPPETAPFKGGRTAAGRRDRLRCYVDEVARHIPDRVDVTVIGPGSVRGRLERSLVAESHRPGGSRRARSAGARRRSEQDLVAGLRTTAGEIGSRRPGG
jgi:hypothetical protein